MVYNSRMACWVASVGVQGTFRLTREELVNNTVVSTCVCSAVSMVRQHGVQLHCRVNNLRMYNPV